MEVTDQSIPMPTLVRFLALLALKIFAVELVDVVILEVGLGGRFDATNVIQAPVVCGITSLGYDHTDILGHTLTEISWEKAGIFKRGVPAITVSQPDEAMRVLEQAASSLDVHLEVVPSLDSNLLNGGRLALDGEHQFLNAALAVALCSTWLQRTGDKDIAHLGCSGFLPVQFIEGLTTASLEGRGQIVTDKDIDNERSSDLIFYLDGAHSPESMDMCAKWFSLAIKSGKHHEKSMVYDPVVVSGPMSGSVYEQHDGTSFDKISSQILMFNCMSVRDPHLLLAHLMNTCATQGVHFRKALFVPNSSMLNNVGSYASSDDSRIDVSWQRNLQRVWENLVQNEKDDAEKRCKKLENSMVFPSVPLALRWLRDNVRQNQSLRFQVLVTGSLHLVGDVLKFLKNRA